MNTKKMYISVVTGLLVICMMACKKGNDFLSKTVTTDLNEQAVFTDSTYTMGFEAGIFRDMAFSFDPKRFGAGGLNACCDESIGGNSTRSNTYVLFTSGTINAANVPDDAWNICYANIRKVNVLLKHLPEARFPASQKRQVEAEVRFLRAWYYSILLKHYGGIPLIGDTVYNASDNINGRRNTYEECVNYIVSECDYAAESLPPQHFSVDYGRITQGACLALKARVLLYAASPLFNGGGESGEMLTNDPKLVPLIGYPAYDKERWKKAVDAAKTVVNLGMYSLRTDPGAPGLGFYNVFLKRVNPEYILTYMQSANATYENLWKPRSRGGSSPNTAYPLGGLVDAFSMKNGLPITDPASGYDPANPYANRDPRLVYSVTYNGALMQGPLGGSVPYEVYTYQGYEPDGLGVGNGTRTGYYVAKMTSNRVGSTERCLPLIRYAEILLNYAEALNEYSGPAGITDILIPLRQRAGIDPGPDSLYGLKRDLTQKEMREVIYHERRVELAFEEHRFWDIRRWKIAYKTDNGPVSGMRVIKNTDGTFAYDPFVVEQRVFRPAMYLWPFPQSEVAKSDELLQNPGW